MVQILLIRPGTTEYDQQGRVQGTLNIPLCEDGRQEVENADRAAARAADRGDLREPVAIGRANGRSLGPGARPESENDRQAPEPRPRPVAGDARVRREGETAEGLSPVAGSAGERLSAARARRSCVAKQRVSAALAKLLKKHKADALFAVVVPEPLASVIRNVVRHDDWGDLWHCCNGKPHWQLIEVPEAAAAK